jgi:tetratricopeptide (TPR) repeat protein
MPGRYYMGVDYRRDHSFRIPNPDLSIKLGTPNACTYCHADQTNVWAADKMAEWYGTNKKQHYGSYIAEVLFEEENPKEKLAIVINDDLFPPITRAVAITELGQGFQEKSKKIIKAQLSNPESMIRLAAVRIYPMNDEKDIQLLINLLNDPVKSVRFEAAVILSEIPLTQIPEEKHTLLQKILNEYEAALLYSADFTASRLNLGNLYSNQGRLDEAIMQFKEAIEIDGEFYPAKINLAMIYNRMGENEKAERLFKEVVDNEPEQYQIQYSLGLLLAEMGKYEEAVLYLKKASDNIPENPRVLYNLAQLQVFLKNNIEAEESFKKILEISPASPEYMMAIIEFYFTQEDYSKARPYVLKVNDLFPDDAQSKQLLDFVNSKLE